MLNKSNFNRFMLRNCFLLGTICAGLLYSGSARAGSVLRHMAPFRVNYTYTGSSSNTATSYTVTSIEMLEQNYFGLYNTDDYMEFDFSVISESGAPITISDSAINNFIKSDDFHKSYYTKVEFDSETNTLKISDKLVNQSVLDQALQDAGIADMSVYAKTADVYGKSEVYTKEEADGKFLTSHQDISGKANVGDSYTKSESDGKYATKSALNEYIKSSEIYDYIDYVAPKAITPTRDAMKAWQDLSNHGKYDLTTTSTGATNEKSVKIGSTTYYFIADEANDDMTQTFNQLLTNGTAVTTSGASESDYTFKVTNGETSTYYKFDTSGINSSKIQISDGTGSDYTFYKISADGSAQYYKVTSTASSAARNTNLTTNSLGRYYYNLSSTSSSYGGALTVQSGIIDKIESDFNKNSASSYGGAIKNAGRIKVISGDFSNNTASSAGGAIYNNNKIDAINGSFYNNFAKEYGGAIRNTGGTIDSIAGTFIDNKTNGYGGAINNNNKIEAITGYFNNNMAQRGGAIASDGTITLIDGTFESNKVTGSGGAITSGGTIKTLAGMFNKNKATYTGGAIFNFGTIQSLSGKFNENTSDNSGGGISNSGDISLINADFNENTAYKGGGLWNVGKIEELRGNFEGNSVTSLGGALLNGSSNDGTKVGIIDVLTANFRNNHAGQDGGAIANGATLGLRAKGQNIVFYNNTDSTGYNDLFGNETGIFHVNAQTGYSVNFGGSIRQVAALNINNVAVTENRGGSYVFNNTIDAGVNLYNGANVKFDALQQADGTISYGVINTTKTMTVDSVAGSSIDMRNDHIDTNTVGGMTLGSNLGLGIDTELHRNSAGQADKIISATATTGDGKIVIDGINLTKSVYGEGDSAKIVIADANTKGKITIAEDIMDNVTGATNYYTKVEYDEDTGELVFTDKLVNKSTLDQALQDAGVSDMSIYAKTADVYTKSQANEQFATIESLGSYATTDSVYTKTQANEAFAAKGSSYTKSESDDKYATKSALDDYVTSDSLDTTLGGYVTTESLGTTLGSYATTDSVYTKTEADNAFAAKGASYTKSESDDKYATKSSLDNYVTSESLNTTLGSYATTDSVYTKTQADNTFAKASDVANTYATKEAIGDMLTKTEAGTTYATKASLNDYVKSSDLNTTLGDYVTSDSLNTTLGSYATNDSVDTKLQGYATTDSVYSKTEMDTKLGDYVKSDALDTKLNDYAKTSDIAETYATKASLNDYVKSDALDTKLNNYVKTDALDGAIDTKLTGYAKTSDLNDYAKSADVYTKDEADGKYATQNAVSALTDRMTQAETDISGIKGSAVMSSGITAEKVAAYEGYAALIDAKQDALSTEQMAVLNSGITAADIATVQTANARLDAMDTTVSDLSADFGDVSDFTNSKTGNLKNDVPSSSKQNASIVTKAIANMDATIGQIHGLAAKVGVENGGANLGQNTTVEEHLTSLAGSIGNRTHYTQQNYIKNNQTVAQSLDNLDIAVGSIKRDFTSAQIANEARFNDIEHNINHLENKMEKGLAANNALAALKPLSSTYQTQLSAAMGGYENNQAFAIGGFHYVTEKVLLNTGVAYGGNNSMSYNVGVTFGF